jgi:hypothetical protein
MASFLIGLTCTLHVRSMLRKVVVRRFRAYERSRHQNGMHALSLRRGPATAVEAIEIEDGIERVPMDALCCVCLVDSKTHLMLPCGHKCVCKHCAVKLEGATCPMCRVKVASVARVYE